LNRIILKKNEERRIKQGHLWVFSNEVEKIVQNEECEVQNGDLVQVHDSKDNFIASGFYNANSLIAVRVLSYKEEVDLQKLFEQKLISAFNFRKSIFPHRNSFRMVFSESDFLPGLIIDKYNGTFVLQVYSFGMEKNIDKIISVLKDKLNAKNIFTKNEEYFRKLEGLPIEGKIYLGEMSDEIIDDGSIKYKINFASSHKTGFYFDQCDNREFAGKFCKGKNMLDGFCNSGGFGLHAAINGASSVTFVDSSSEEIKNAKFNFELNKLNSKSEFISSDVFDYLESCIASGKKFDVVILDPPAFAKNKKSLPKAIKAYEKLNRLGMEILNLVNDELQPGFYNYQISLQDFSKGDKRITISSGTYFYSIYIDDGKKRFIETKKMTIIK